MDQPKSLRVGIADDLRSARVLLREMLTALDHEVVFEAQSGPELLEGCIMHRPDLVVTDNLMPGMSGVEAAALIYERCRTPVILVSVCSDPEVVLTAERKHVAVYLVKPLEKANLEAAIRLAMQQFAESKSELAPVRRYSGPHLPSAPAPRPLSATSRDLPDFVRP